MFCLKCGQQIPETSKFCFRCGADLPAVAGFRAGRADVPIPQTSVPLSTEAAPSNTAPLLGQSTGREVTGTRNEPAVPIESTGTGHIPDRPALTGEAQRTRTVTTTDNSLQILADRDLSSDVVVSLPSGTEV